MAMDDDFFADRRTLNDRRAGRLSIPKPLCRRNLDRRQTACKYQISWWLLANYVDNRSNRPKNLH